MKISSGFAIATLAVGTSAVPCVKSCKATKSFPGWDGIKYAFVFGDSYTTTGFNTSLEAPSPTNPLGNPAYPGWTASNGPNWVDFLTVKYNASILQTYNLAYGGATVDSALVAPYLPTVLSLKDQVQDLFLPTYGPDSDPDPEVSPAWSGKDTLFAIWIGINDVGNSWYKDDRSALNLRIFAVYSGLVEDLYAAGARNFLLLNVPPVDRAPLTLAQGQESQTQEREDVTEFNGLVRNLAEGLKTEHKGANVWVYDAHQSFTDVLDEPARHAQTEGYKNVDEFCEAYQNGTPEWDTFNEDCGIAVDEYFWLNSLHPTYPMHDVLAEGIAELLSGDPNICGASTPKAPAEPEPPVEDDEEGEKTGDVE